MNWFERYGIAGAYFVALTIAWLYAYTCNANFWAGDNVKTLAMIGAGIFIPVGYIISVLSQFLYYRASICGRSLFPQIHRESIKGPEFYWFKYLIEEKEDTIEVDMAVQYRLAHKEYTCAGNKDLRERFERLNQFITKRWDVLAINQILMVSTVVSFFISLIIAQGIINEAGWQLPCDLRLSLFLLAMSALIILVFRLSQKVLSNQLVRTSEQLHKYFGRTPKINITSENKTKKVA